MPRTRLILTVCLAGACGTPEPVADALPARLVVDGEPGGRMLDAAGRAVVCARDTTAAVVAVGDAWAGAVSMRTLLPGPREMSIQPNLDRDGAAMVALRPLADSTLAAWVATSGTVRLAAGDSISGTFDVTARRDSTTIRLTGTFASIPQESCP